MRSDTEVDAVFARRLLQAEPADTADLRRAIEGEATRLACARRTEADIAEMRLALERRAAAMDGGDYNDFVNADCRFHRTIVHSAHNDLFDELFRCLAAEFKPPLNEQATRSSAEQRNRAHHDVVAAIAAREEAAAIRAALVHLNVTAKRT